jgi:hypothetical protein
LDVVEAGALTVMLEALPSVADGVMLAEMSDVELDVEFSWYMPPTRDGLGLEREWDLVADEDGMTDEVDDDVVELDVDVVVVDELVGASAALLTGAADDVASTSTCFEEDPPPVDPSVLKITMLADPPFGTVTTQYEPPPSPTVASGLLTTPVPSVAGLMEHWRPLHPPLGHSILIPYVGGVAANTDVSQTGLYPILRYVRPLASIFAPAT